MKIKKSEELRVYCYESFGRRLRKTLDFWRTDFIKATSHLTIFMRGMHAKGKIQRNNYHYGQRGQSFEGETSSVSLIAYLHKRNIAERATSDSTILCACVGAINGTDDVLLAKDGPHCTSW